MIDMKLIDKNLLEAVLEVKINLLLPKLNGSLVVYETKEGIQYINVYELAYKCQKYANKNGCIIEVKYSAKAYESYYYTVVDLCGIPVLSSCVDSDLEAPFKAVQALMKHLNS